MLASLITHLHNRRRHLAQPIAWLVVGLCLVHPCPPVRPALAQGAKPVVHVFLQLDAKSSVVEKTLQQNLPELRIVVFGRSRDFEEGLSNGHPDAVLSIAPVLEQRGKTVSLQGNRGGKPAEPYLLASVNEPLQGRLAGKTIGVVDLLGRDGTQTFLNGLLKATDIKIKRVAKIEDLLPLLEFSAADGIVLPSSMLGRLLERTRLAIKTRELPGGPVGLPAVAVLNLAVRDLVVRSFQNLDLATKRLLGVDSWSVQ
ncbi:MAG TPA: hypothetical protein VJ860_08660 [Polyangia bacterium]|nr:hypothetical protein [Polyangia bacterium]